MVVRSWGEFGLTEEPGYFSEPPGIALSGDGSVYVADNGNNRIQKFTPNGDFLVQWPVGGPPSIPTGRPSGVAVAPDGDLYVSQFNEGMVVRFSAVGERLAVYRGAQVAGIAVSPEGMVYAADVAGDRVLRLAGP